MILSYIEGARTDSIVYSCLAVYGRDRTTKWLPGPWFVAALEDLGRNADAVRQTLFRMTRMQQLAVRKVGRTNHYKLSQYGEVAAESGSRKLFEPRIGSWDGRWSLVSYSYASDERTQRDRLRGLLELHGFAALGRGHYVHPREFPDALMQTLMGPMCRPDRVSVFRAERFGPADATSFVAGLWDLEGINHRYRLFLAEFSKIRRRRSLYRRPRDAFRVRLALSVAYLQVAWQDPDLPSSLLPREWGGHQAQRLAQRFYLDLMPRTLEYIASLLQERCGREALGSNQASRASSK